MYLSSLALWLVTWWLGGCPWLVGWKWPLVGGLSMVGSMCLCYSLGGNVVCPRGSVSPQSGRISLCSKCIWCWFSGPFVLK